MTVFVDIDCYCFCVDTLRANMSVFSNEEYADIVFAYGRANGNTRAAQRMYRELYPNRRVPHHSTFSNTFRRLRETGSLRFMEPRVNERQHAVVIDERILEKFDSDPTISIRKVARELGVSTWKVWSVVNADGRYPYHYTPVQGNIMILNSILISRLSMKKRWFSIHVFFVR